MNPVTNPAEPEHREIPTRRDPKLNLFRAIRIYPRQRCLFQASPRLVPVLEPILSSLLNPVTSAAFSSPLFQCNILYKPAVSDMTAFLINSIWPPQ